MVMDYMAGKSQYKTGIQLTFSELDWLEKQV